MSLRTTLILILIAAVIGGVVYFNPLQRGGTGEPNLPWFYNVSDKDIIGIDIDHQGRNFSYVRDSNRKWYFRRPENIPVDTQRFGGITLLLSGPQARRELVSQNIKDPEQYGLLNPTTKIDVSLTGDRLITLRLGDKTPDGGAHYAQIGDVNDLYLVDSSWGDVISRLVTEPPYPLWYFRMNPDKIVGITVRHKGVEVAFKKEKEVWVFDDGKNGSIDENRWASVLPLLGGPNSIKLVKEMVEGAGLYGIAEDSTQIVLTFQTQTEAGIEYNEDITYSLGNKAADGSGYYAQAKDFEPVFLLDGQWSDIFINLATNPPYKSPP